MRILATLLIWSTIWVDFCLVLGVIFTSDHGGVKMAAVINIGSHSISSASPGGASMILFISIWTALLACCGLWALAKIPRHNLLSHK
jgi:hypothetical protein